MSLAFLRSVFAGLIGLGACLGAGVQAQTAPPSGAQAPPTRAAESHAQPVTAAASAPAEKKKKRTSRAKTPPGKPSTGVAVCNEGDKAQRQRCLHDMYGPGAPRL